MKKLSNFQSNGYYFLLLGFLFLIQISIGAAYILFTALGLGLILFLTIGRKHAVVRFHWKRHLPPFTIPFLGFILVTLISILFAVDMKESFMDSKELLIFLLFPIYFLILNSEKRIRTSLNVILLSAVLHALVGIYQGTQWGITLDRRIKGFTSHWMTFAGLLMFVLIFFLISSIYNKRKPEKWIHLSLLIPVLVAIGFSLTRSVWVGIAFSIGLFLVYYNARILFIIIPLILLAVFFLPESIQSRITSIVDLNNETNKDRIYMAVTGFNIFKDFPLFGVGANNVVKVYDQYKPEGAPINPHLHNNFIHILAERGIFALLSLIAAFLLAIIHLVRIIRNGTPFFSRIAVAVLFAFIAFLVAGLFEYNFGHSQIKFILFYFLSLPFIPMIKEAEHDLSETR